MSRYFDVVTARKTPRQTLTAVDAFQRDTEERKLLADFRKLDDYGRRVAVAMIGGLAKVRS